MKKFSIALVVACLMALTAGTVSADVYTDTTIVDEYLSVWFYGSDSVNWTHENPYDGGSYEDALTLGLIDSVTLTVNASGIVTNDDYVSVRFQDKNNVWHNLPGYLVNGNNVFTLDAEWLNGVTVRSTLTFVNNGSGWNYDWMDDACINYSILTVTGQPVPVPGAVLLGVLGLGAAGMKLRRRNAA